MSTFWKIVFGAAFVMVLASTCTSPSVNSVVVEDKPSVQSSPEVTNTSVQTTPPADSTPPSSTPVPSQPEKPAVTKEDAAQALSGLRKSVDKMEGTTWYHHPTTLQNSARNQFYLYFGQDKEGRLTALRLYTMYYASDWLFVKSAWAKADGEDIVFPQTGESLFGWERDNNGGNIWEWSDAPVITATEMESVEKIANAKSVTVRYEGRQYRNDKDITAAQLKAMRETLTAYKIAKEGLE